MILGFILMAIVCWITGPAAVQVYFTFIHGWAAPCTTTWYIGPGAPVGVQVSKTRLYWCPFGMVGYELEME